MSNTRKNEKNGLELVDDSILFFQTIIETAKELNERSPVVFAFYEKLINQLKALKSETDLAKMNEKCLAIRNCNADGKEFKEFLDEYYSSLNEALAFFNEQMKIYQHIPEIKELIAKAILNLSELRSREVTINAINYTIKEERRGFETYIKIFGKEINLNNEEKTDDSMNQSSPLNEGERWIKPNENELNRYENSAKDANVIIEKINSFQIEGCKERKQIIQELKTAALFLSQKNVLLNVILSANMTRNQDLKSAINLFEIQVSQLKEKVYFFDKVDPLIVRFDKIIKKISEYPLNDLFRPTENEKKIANYYEKIKALAYLNWGYSMQLGSWCSLYEYQVNPYRDNLYMDKDDERAIYADIISNIFPSRIEDFSPEQAADETTVKIEKARIINDQKRRIEFDQGQLQSKKDARIDEYKESYINAYKAQETRHNIKSVLRKIGSFIAALIPPFSIVFMLYTYFSNKNAATFRREHPLWDFHRTANYPSFTNVLSEDTSFKSILKQVLALFIPLYSGIVCMDYSIVIAKNESERDLIVKRKYEKGFYFDDSTKSDAEKWRESTQAKMKNEPFLARENEMKEYKKGKKKESTSTIYHKIKENENDKPTENTYYMDRAQDARFHINRYGFYNLIPANKGVATYMQESKKESARIVENEIIRKYK